METIDGTPTSYKRPTALPLFVCHANCCRSVLAKYLYEHLFPDSRALSAGIEVGEQINDRARAMLQYWGIDASRHQPRKLHRELCETADAIFVMGPEYLLRLLKSHGNDLAAKAYLFADPFSVPHSFARGEYLVYDPSFDERSISQLVNEFCWFQDRVSQIYDALRDGSPELVPATQYRDLLNSM